MSIIWPLLLLAGFITFSNSNPTDKPVEKTFLELHNEALNACAINSTGNLINLYNGMINVESLCPMNCYVQAVGIINDGGVNKLAVNWTRDWVDFIYDTENTVGLHPRDSSMRFIETAFDLSHKFIQSMNDACSAKNDTALKIIFETFGESMEQDKLIQDKFIPSEEDSPMVELILNTVNTCSTKFNVSAFTLAFYVRAHGQPINKNKHLCFYHCILSELDIVSETGLNEPWAGLVRDQFNKRAHNDVMPIFDDITILLNSKCSTELNELPEEYFFGAFVENISKYTGSRSSTSISSTPDAIQHGNME